MHFSVSMTLRSKRYLKLQMQVTEICIFVKLQKAGMLSADVLLGFKRNNVIEITKT